MNTDAKTIRINVISLRVREDGFFEYDFYPDRTFRKTAHVVLWPKESWFNIQYLKFFRDCDLAETQVVVHTSRNFLPVASLIAHRVVLEKTNNMISSVFHPRSQTSTYGFDLPGHEQILGIKKWDMGFHRDRAHRRFLPRSDEELYALRAYFDHKPMAIEAEAFDWFERHKSRLPIGVTCVELKCSWSRKLIERLKMHQPVPLVGADKKFQSRMMQDYGCDQFFMTVQLLAGLFNRWSFIALHGASSVFSLLVPVNLLASMDWDNLSEEMQSVRSEINLNRYGIPTIGSRGLRREFAEALALDDELFASTLGLAMVNREKALWPKVIIERQ